MGSFDRHGAQRAYDQVYGDGMPHHEVTHDLLADTAGFEAVHMSLPEVSWWTAANQVPAS